MGDQMDILKEGVSGLRGTSANTSGITTYYHFDSIGYANYVNHYQVPRHLLFIGVQSAHPAGGSYWTPWSYWITARHNYSGGWKGQWSEEKAGPFSAQTVNGKYRNGNNYYDELTENWANDTYYTAVQLASGGSGTVNNGWLGYVVEFEVAP